jgi:tellurite resistance protein TerC
VNYLFLAAEVPLVIPGWAWGAFLLFVGAMLALDLGVFSKKEEAPSFRKAVAWCIVWVSLAGAFAFLLSAWRGSEDAELFAAAYILELALSVDNLFIFILVFAHFSIPERLQHRVLFWGILGAVAMRALFIIVGVAAVDRFTWLLPLFGAFLLFTGFKLAFSKDENEGKSMEENFIVKVARKCIPLTTHLHGNSFWAVEHGRRVFTPLFLVLLVVEGTDLIFALDSIPAVLGILPPGMAIEERRFIAFTSNIFAIMGLRSMYFALSGFVQYVRFLKPALAFILVFIGIKMVLPWAAKLGQPDGQVAAWVPASLVHAGVVHLPTQVSLGVIGVILAVAIALSVAFPKKA